MQEKLKENHREKTEREKGHQRERERERASDREREAIIPLSTHYRI